MTIRISASCFFAQVSDLKCPAPKPPITDVCNIPNCHEADFEEVKFIQPKRVIPRDHIDTFRDGPIYTVSVNNTKEYGPEYSFSAITGWLYTEWSDVSRNFSLYWFLVVCFYRIHEMRSNFLLSVITQYFRYAFDARYSAIKRSNKI